MKNFWTIGLVESYFFIDLWIKKKYNEHFLAEVQTDYGKSIINCLLARNFYDTDLYHNLNPVSQTSVVWKIWGLQYLFAISR